MPSGIDHIVIAVPDLDAAAAELTEKVGLAFSAGGRHPGLGTFNRIAFLGEAYLELIGVDDADAASGWAIGAAAVRALRAGGGFATWALSDSDIRGTVARLQANGSRIGPVTHNSRERDDGERVEWWTASPSELGPGRPPFLIKHLAAGTEWGVEALVARDALMHPIGSPVVLRSLQIAIADPWGLAADCYRDLGMGFWAVASVAVCSVGRHTIRLVPSPPAEAGATFVIGAGVAAARTVHALGMRFELEPVAFPLPLLT